MNETGIKINEMFIIVGVMKMLYGDPDKPDSYVKTPDFSFKKSITQEVFTTFKGFSENIALEFTICSDKISGKKTTFNDCKEPITDEFVIMKIGGDCQTNSVIALLINNQIEKLAIYPIEDLLFNYFDYHFELCGNKRIAMPEEPKKILKPEN